MTKNPPNNASQKNKGEESYGLTDALTKKLLKALASEDVTQVQKLLHPLHVADIADFINLISHEQRNSLVSLLRDDFKPEILVELEPDVREEIIELLGTEESAEVIGQLDTDDAVEVIEDLDSKEQQEILESIPDTQRSELEEGLSFPEDSAGRLMERQMVSVPQYWSVGQTIDYLRSESDLPRDFPQVYVVDPVFKPIGAVKLSHIMRSGREILVKDLVTEELKSVPAEMDQEEAAFLFRQYGLSSAPVINQQGRLIGVISVDDIFDVMQEEAEEDILHMGGVSETDIYSDMRETVQRRFPWLLVNLMTAIAASAVIWLFEGMIEKLAALAVLMPIVASMGGNAGTQTLTVAVRALATKELQSANALRVVGKEILVGGANGLLFAIIAGAAIFWWYNDPYLSGIFAIAIVITLLLAGLAGALIPLGLEKIGVDPATASTVFLTTITDVVAFGVFLGLATVWIL